MFDHASNCKKWLLIKKIIFRQENSRSMNVRNKWTKFEPNPMIFKDFEPITLWVTTPMARRGHREVKVQYKKLGLQRPKY